jgi:DNA (cytosine-5)-methyltransferase 1
MKYLTPEPDIGELNELALFAGAGGGILGGKLLGWRTIAAVEFSAFCARRLMQRQNEGHLAPFPIWDDVRTFDGRPLRGLVDVLSAGFPCQDVSSAGSGAGLDGERSGLYFEVERLIREIRPRKVVLENSPNLVNNGLARVLAGLAAMGFDAQWGIISAADTGAPHARERCWVVADANGIGQPRQGEHQQSIDPAPDAYREANRLVDAFREGALPFVCGSHDGVGSGVDQLTAIGNGQVPAVVARAWSLLA